MRKFEDLPEKEQERIVAGFLTIAVRESDHPLQRTPEAIMQLMEIDKDELWRDVLAEAGVDTCEPWQGWPQRFPRPERPPIDHSETKQ